jgi:hypothetical protein
VKEAEALHPTVIFMGYGMVESYEGEAGLAKFEQGYRRMLDAMQKVAPKVVLLSPTMHEDLGKPLMDPAAHNRDIERYGAAIAKIARERMIPFVDLYRPMVAFKQRYPKVRLTSNGIALNDGGYWLIAREIERQLGFADPCRIEVGADGHVISTSGADAAAVDGGGFRVVRKQLPGPSMPAELRLAGVKGDAGVWLRAAGLAAGQWGLFVDGKRVAQADAKEWEKGIELSNDPDADAAEKLRAAAVRVNEIFYRRSRPFNDHERHWTYIGDDGAQYDKQLAELDKAVAKLRVPPAHEYKFVRSADSSHQQ